MNPTLSRRAFLATAAGAATTLHAAPAKPTQFQLACTTLPYNDQPLERALFGIRAAGFRYVAWGDQHREQPDAKRTPLLAPDASPGLAKTIANQGRLIGLEPVLMFSFVYPEAPDGLKVLRQRILQASAASIPQVLTFGHTKGDNRAKWLKVFKELAPLAADRNVTLVIKQHGGDTGSGAACAELTREINHPNIKVNYDAGNVMDYLHINPLTDLKLCVEEVRSFCMKDHRNFLKDEDCAPGLGEIDHYKLLAQVAFTGRTIPLCCENIWEPEVPRPKDAAGIDKLAQRTREYLEKVIAHVQATP